MSPHVATAFCVLLIAGLFWLDRDQSAPFSKALWIPLVWILIAGSRSVGQWVGLGTPIDQDQAYMTGDPVDRFVLSALIALGITVLFTRRRRAWEVIKSNPAIVCYFAYCGLSIFWSDYSDISSKRWIRALGDLIMVIIIATVPHRLAGLKKLFARVSFLLLTVSVLFIRYYPELGRAYGYHSGRLTWTGLTPEKNTLGLISVICGLASLWRLLEAWRERKHHSWIGPSIAHGLMVLTAMYLLYKADSATSKACFVLAGGVLVATSLRTVYRRAILVHCLVGAVVIGAFVVLFLNLGSSLLSSMARDSTLTGRTDLWKLAISLTANPLIGTGFESFWIGRRLATMREVFGELNQAHNGYLEIFLNLGWIGVALLAAMIVTGYRKIVIRVRQRGAASNLMLALFVVALIHNFTEASFKMMFPVWIVFLLSITFPVVRSERPIKALPEPEVGPIPDADEPTLAQQHAVVTT